MDTIIKKVLNKDREAFIELYDSIKSRVYFLSWALCRGRIESADIAKKAITTSFQAILTNTVTTQDEFSAYCEKQAISLCSDLMLSGEVEYPESPVILEEALDPKASSAKNYILGLPTIPSWVLVLRVFAGLTEDDIAAAISSSREYVDKVVKSEYENLDTIYRFVTRRGGFCVAPTKELIRTEFEDEAMKLSIPSEIENRVSEYIIERSDEPRKKIDKKKLMLIVIPVIILIIALIAGMTVYRNKKLQEEAEAAARAANDVTLNVDAIKADGGMEVTSVPEELDQNMLYFADITIKDHGVITVMLDHVYAPITTKNFIKLSVENFYDNLTFHRIMSGFMMQGGDPLDTGNGGSDETIVGEFTQNGYENYISHTRGTLSMARATDYDSASSQFFIVHEDSTFLDGQYAAFGYVVNGMNIVDTICESAMPTDGNGSIAKDAQPIMTDVSIWCINYEDLATE